MSAWFVVLEREREETKEAESSVAALRRRVSSQHEAIAALDAEIEQYRARAANLRRGPFLPYICGSFAPTDLRDFALQSER